MSPASLRTGRVVLAIALCLVTTSCGLVAAAALEAIKDGIDGGEDGDGGDVPGDPRPAVAVLHALPDATHASDVIDQMIGTGAFESVVPFDAAVSTPTLAQLQTYDAVLVVADGAFFDAVGFGNVLAAYAEGGRGVVTATYARPGSGIGGAWDLGGYDAILASGVRSGDGPIPWLEEPPSHPIVAGLPLMGSGSGADRPDFATVTSGSTLVASWATGEPLVAVRVLGSGARLAALAFHVVTDTVDPSFVDAESTAKAIVARALRWSVTGN